MSEIQTETVDAQAESVFSFDLFNKVDEEEIDELDELDAEVETTVVESETKALPSRPSGLSVLESAPDRAPYELDQEALFRELIAQHQRRLYRFVIKYIDHPDDAADITQQAFVEAARTIATFRGDSKLSTWLFGIAMNMVRNYLSRAPHRVHKFETDDSLIGIASAELDPSDSLSQRELLVMAEKAFSDLPIEMSEVLGLVAVDEISYQDAAEILCIPLGTVRSRVSRARAVLRAQFEQAGVKLQF
jgi:RNA polymerase sigma-70 factor (ECF subfamily)